MHSNGGSCEGKEGPQQPPQGRRAYSLALPVSEAHGTSLASQLMLQWDNIIAGSSSEMRSMHPEGMAERTPDQAEWKHHSLLVYTLMSKPEWRRIDLGFARC